MSHDPSANPRSAYATFCTDNFVPGVLSLANSLRRHGNNLPLVVMHLGDLTEASINAISSFPDVELRRVRPIENPHRSADPRFSVVFAKLHVFGLTEFRRVVFIDADALVLADISDLLDLDTEFAAAPDHGIGLRENEFNSGVFVCQPNAQLYSSLLSHVASMSSRDGGDQGFLNTYFQGRVTHLKRCDNTLKRIYWHHPHLFELDQIRILHFVGDKPWHVPPSDFAYYRELYDLWWSYYPSDILKIPRHVPTPDETTSVRRNELLRRLRRGWRRLANLTPLGKGNFR